MGKLALREKLFPAFDQDSPAPGPNKELARSGLQDGPHVKVRKSIAAHKATPLTFVEVIEAGTFSSDPDRAVRVGDEGEGRTPLPEIRKLEHLNLARP